MGAPFEAPVALTVDAAGIDDRNLTITADGLTMVFESYRTGNVARLFVATRAAPGDPFGAPALIDALAAPNPGDYDGSPYLSADGQELWFASTRDQVGGGSLGTAR